MQSKMSPLEPTSAVVSLATMDQAAADLAALAAGLKEARKVLLRDWEALTPKERSAGTRAVKNLETKQRELRDFLDMHRHVWEA